MKHLTYAFIGLAMICCSIKLYAQAPEDKIKAITPMHEFLKANMDSTIILQFNSNWIHSPEYFILSKKGDTLTAFKYQTLPAYDNRIVMPKSVASKLRKNRITQIFSTPIDINQYFNPQFIDPDSIRKLWNNLSSLHPWQMKDDAKDGLGCPLEKGKDPIQIYDGGGITLFLITKDDIKKLSFYAPGFYEKECPGRKGRQDILKIEQYFLTHFQPVKL